MPKEVLIYGRIDSYSSTEFFKNIGEALKDNQDETIVIRINTNGGEPEYGWGEIARIQELKNKIIKVDGKAHSMGLFALCYVEDVEALDVSQFLLHRAAYPSWFESDPNYFTDVYKSNLANINANLEKAFRNKIDVAVFEEMKGVKVKDIFSMDGRIEVNLTAAEAKKIGLVKSILKITPAKQAELSSIAASAGIQFEDIKIAAENENNPTQIKNNMTLEEFKSKHPEAYNQIFAAGQAAEKDRVGAWMAFIDVDTEHVSKAIKEGKIMSQTDMAELSRKSYAAEALKKVEADTTKTVTTGEQPAGTKEKVEAGSETKTDVAAFEKLLDEQLKIGKK